MTYERPSIYEEMAKHSSHLWVMLGDERGVIRSVPIYEDVAYLELIVRGFQIVNERITNDGIWVHRWSRAEAEVRGAEELQRRIAGAPVHACALPPRPLGTFAPRRRIVFQDSEIHAMFGAAA